MTSLVFLRPKGVLPSTPLFPIISLFFLFSFFLFCFSSSFSLLNAAPTLDHPLTLSELVDIALENHPSTKQAWWNARRAAYALGSAESAYYPSIGFEANACHGRYYKFINGPDTNYNIVGTDIALSFLLYDFGERQADVNATKMALAAANWETAWNLQQVMIQVLENAYAVFHTREVYQAACISLKEAEVVWNAAHELNRAGLAPVTDVYTSRANLSQMKMDLSRQKALLDVQMEKLIGSLGLAVGSSLEIAPATGLPAPRQLEVKYLIELALKQRADLLEKRARLSETIARKKQIASSYGPKLTFGAKGGSDHDFRANAHGAHYEVRLDFELPLFTGFDAAYQKRMAFADSQISMEELAALELDIALDVFTQSRTLQAAQEIMPEADEYLASSIKAFEGVMEKYQAGKERITELSNAQLQLAEARVRYSDVKTKWLQALANLAYATGTLPMEKK